MGFRFWKRVNVAPGLDLILSKSGFSVSTGPPGLKATHGTSGSRMTASIPGSGLFYTKRMDSDSAGTGPRSESGGRGKVSAKDAQRALSPGCLGSLTMPESEQELLAGLREIATGNYKKSLGHFIQSSETVDGAFMAGLIALREERFEEAHQHLKTAYENSDQLGEQFDKHGVDLEIGLPITENIYARLRPDLRGVVLAMAELAQLRGNREYVLQALEWLHGRHPDDPVIRLALAEALVTENPDSERENHRVVELASRITNESPVHAALLYYKARALMYLALYEEAKTTLTEAKSDDPEDLPGELYEDILYRRATAYEAMGQDGNAENDLETLYSINPNYEDVTERLGISGDEGRLTSTS